MIGLALLIVVLKFIALRKGDERYNQAARFWAKIFAVNFLLGVVTGIPMEFQFGTNWSEFSRQIGGVIGQPLAMEGVFSFFLESTFLGFFYLESRSSPSWRISVETVIMISMRTDADTAKALHDAAQFYKVDIEAIAAKVKQDFAAKEKAKATQKATAKPQTKAAKKSTAA